MEYDNTACLHATTTDHNATDYRHSAEQFRTWCSQRADMMK
jgi:hypothetical protein